MEPANYTQAIEAAIEMVEARVAEHGDRFLREAHTRYWLVGIVLAGLGWDVHEPSQVYVEYPTPGGKWVDYALLRPSTGTPVEAKAISQEETRLWTADEDPGEIQEWEQERLDQLEGYVNDLQLATGYAVLTDGASWDIYDLSRTGAFSGKRLHYFDTLSSVKFGGPILTIDRTIFEMWMVYPPTKRGPSEGRRVNGKGN